MIRPFKMLREVSEHLDRIDNQLDQLAALLHEFGENFNRRLERLETRLTETNSTHSKTKS